MQKENFYFNNCALNLSYQLTKPNTIVYKAGHKRIQTLLAKEPFHQSSCLNDRELPAMSFL